MRWRRRRAGDSELVTRLRVGATLRPATRWLKPELGPDDYELPLVRRERLRLEDGEEVLLNGLPLTSAERDAIRPETPSHSYEPEELYPGGPYILPDELLP